MALSIVEAVSYTHLDVYKRQLLKLLELMHEYGVRATLKLCTKKYEQLIHNGRTDILELLADHELAFHMTNHSVHPIPSEYLDRMGFAQGALEFERREGQGFARLKSLTGQNLTSYGHPGVCLLYTSLLSVGHRGEIVPCSVG